MIDDDLAAGDIDGIWSAIFPQGTLSPATITAVPLLAAAARTAPSRRDEIAWLIGMIADARHAYGDLLPDARAAVAALPLPPLDDPDPQVRAAAAYIVARAGGPVTALHERLTTEDHPEVRPSLLLALGELDPVRAAARFPYDGPAGERFAAALAILRSGGMLPLGAAEAVTGAIDDGFELPYAWSSREPVDDLLLDASDTAAGDLVAALARSPSADTRRAVVFAVAERARLRRSATQLVPLLSALRDDPDPGVRDEFRTTLRSSGRAAAAPFRDWIAAAAGSDAAGPFRDWTAAAGGSDAPGPFRDWIAAAGSDAAGPFRDWIAAAGSDAAAGPDAATPDRGVAPDGGRAARMSLRAAVETLRWLGDPRWVELDPRPHPADMRWIPCNAGVLAAVRRHLPGNDDLVDLLGFWGPRAAEAVPDLIDLLPETGSIAAGALARIGHADPLMLPHLWGLATDGDIDAAAAIRRLTGDPRLLLAALESVFRAGGDRPDSGGPRPGSSVGHGLRPLVEAAYRRPSPPSLPVRPPLLDPGPDLLPVVPAARARLTGECPRSHDERLTQILAATVVIAGAAAAEGTAAEGAAVEGAAVEGAAGDLAAARDTLRALLVPGFYGVADAAELLAELTGPDPDLLRRLDDLLSDRVIRSGRADDFIWIDELISARLAALLTRLREAAEQGGGLGDVGS